MNSASSAPPASASPVRARRPSSTSAQPHSAASVSASSSPSAIGRIAVVPHGRNRNSACPVSASGTDTARARSTRKASTPPAQVTTTPAAHTPQVTPNSPTNGARNSG